MNAPSVDLKDHLEDAGLGLVFGTNLFVGEEPASPDNCVTIFDTPGFGRQTTMQRGEEYHRPSVQVRSRNNDYRAGYSALADIVDELHALGHREINGTTYEVIMCVTEPAPLGKDENGRHWWIANFDIQRH